MDETTPLKFQSEQGDTHQLQRYSSVNEEMSPSSLQHSFKNDDIANIEDSILFCLNHPDDDEEESEEPIGHSNHHVLQQIHLKGSYKTSHANQGDVSVEKVIETIDFQPTVRLDVTFSITAINVIDPITETFEAKVRIFAFWRVDLHCIGMEDVAQRARLAGHYCHMKRHEIDKFSELSPVPVFHAMNAVSMDDSELADMRVYGGERGETAVLWNKGYKFTCKTHFKFADFPFDRQELLIQLRLNDLKQWEHFNLSVSTVQFHKQALEHSEWKFCEPVVSRSTPPTAGTDIRLPMSRHPGYYVQNIVLIMSGLVLLTLLVFALEVEDIGTRLMAVFTLILNTVAFKLFYSTLIPKVSYNTVLDYYIFENFAILGLMSLFCIVPSFYMDESTVGIERAERVNYGMLGLSAFLILVNMVKFFGSGLYRTKMADKSGCKTNEIVVQKDKNWYSFQYATPHYLPSTTKVSNE